MTNQVVLVRSAVKIHPDGAYRTARRAMSMDIETTKSPGGVDQGFSQADEAGVQLLAAIPHGLSSKFSGEFG